MTDLLEYIKKMQEMYGDNVITTADKIKRPDPKPIVKDIEAINEFMKRNPQADGGRIPFEKAGSVKAYPDRIKTLVVPEGYVTAQQLAEELGIAKSTLKKFRTKGATVDKYPLKGFINENFKPIRVAGNYTYYLKPTEKMLENYNNFKNRTTISRDLLNDVKKLHNSKLIKDLRKSKKKVLPTLEEVIEVLGKDVKSHGRAANAMATLSKMYSGEEYRLLKLPKNEETGKFIFKALRQGGKFNPYKAAFYNLAIEEIDKTLGNETGTLKNFKRYFKDNLNKYLGKGHGVSLNEVASISGMVSNDMGPYGAFVDLTNSKINKGLLANFQGTLTNALTEIDKLKGREKVEAIKAFNKTHIPNFKKQIAAKYGNKLANSIRFTEIVPGKKIDPKIYSKETLARYKDQKIDLESLAKKKGYYLDVKGARPYTEFLEKGEFTKAGKERAVKTLTQMNAITKKLIKSGFRCGAQQGLTCKDPRAYTKSIMETMELAKQGDNAAIAKINKMGKLMKGFKGAAKWTGWGLLAEIGFAAPLAAVDYAKGANKDEIISNITYGLAGKSIDEQLKEKYAGYGQAQKLFDLYDKAQKAEELTREQGGYRSLFTNLQREEDAYKAAEKAMDPFMIPTPHLEEGRYFDENKVFTDLARDESRLSDYMTEREKIGQERMEKMQPVQFYTGAKYGGLNGDKSGPAPESGPMSQGLRSLYNNGKKL